VADSAAAAGARRARGVDVTAFGDSALLITLGDRPDRRLTALAHRAAAAVETIRKSEPALGRPVPAHASVLVPFDPLALDREAAIVRLQEALVDLRSPAERSTSESGTVEIEVRYGGPDGPDLDHVAEQVGLRPADIVELHATARYVVLFLGFAPGFAYLGGLAPELRTARLATPRERVPAGSVAIAGEHSAVYPLAMPGGWNVIGRTDLVLFDPRLDPPTRLTPGASVRFVPAR